MADPIGPMARSVRPRPHPLLYLLVCLLVANLAVTLLLYRRPVAVPGSATPEIPLPHYLTSSTLSDLAARIQANFNDRNWDAFYGEFDPVAQVQFTQHQLEEQFERLGPLIGQIDRAAYSHYKFLGKQDAGNAFELDYALQVSGGTFNSGILTITFIDRGDHLGIFSVFLNGKSH